MWILETGGKLSIPTPKITLTEQKLRRLERGKPLLVFGDLSLSWRVIRRLFQEVVEVVIEYCSPEADEIENMRQLAADLPSLKKAVRTWFRTKALSDEAGEGEGGELMAGVLQTTLRPFLAAHAEVLLPGVEQNSWYRGRCLICGGKPDIAFLDKERGARWLMCSCCNAQWRFLRIGCPYCGNQEQKTLVYFTDDSELYRLNVCKKCLCYLKTIDLRRSESVILFPLERILTLEIDRQAIEAGYKAG